MSYNEKSPFTCLKEIVRLLFRYDIVDNRWRQVFFSIFFCFHFFSDFLNSEAPWQTLRE